MARQRPCGAAATKRPPWGTHHGAADFVRILVSSAARFGPCVFAPTAFWAAGQGPPYFNKCFGTAARPFLSSAHGLKGPLRQRAEIGQLEQPADRRRRAKRRFQTTRAVQRDSGNVGLGSYLAVPLTSGGGLLSGVKLRKEDQKLTFGSKVGLPLQSSHIPRRPKRLPGAKNRPGKHPLGSCLTKHRFIETRVPGTLTPSLRRERTNLGLLGRLHEYERPPLRRVPQISSR